MYELESYIDTKLQHSLTHIHFKLCSIDCAQFKVSDSVALLNVFMQYIHEYIVYCHTYVYVYVLINFVANTHSIYNVRVTVALSTQLCPICIGVPYSPLG